MEVRTTNTYRFYTTATIPNKLRDRRHRRGLQSLEAIKPGTQVRVEELAPFEDGKQLGNHSIKNYFIDGTIIREPQMLEALQSQDAGQNDAPRSLDDLAARNFSSREWFAYHVLERLIKNGEVTLERCDAVWNEPNSDGE